MLHFAANLSMLYGEMDFLERFAAANAAGFRGVEYLFPYAYAEGDLAERLRAAELRQVLFNLPAGDWAAGERGIACLPDRIEEFRSGVFEAIRYAKALDCKQLNCLAGKVPHGADPAAVHGTFVQNVRFAAQALGNEDISLLIEPVNTRDVPGFFVSTSAHALSMMDEAGSGNVKLQYDVYHMQRMEGELAATLDRNVSRIGHVQIADNPGRHEPGTGEINYSFLFEHLQRIGYAGWIGCEYIPLTTTDAGLGWLGHMAGAGIPTVGAR